MEKSLKTKVNLFHPAHFLGFGFGSGLVPFMPGTMGSLAAIPLILLMSSLALVPYLLITIVASVVGIYICQKVSDDLGVHDHGAIVWDEIAGMYLVLLVTPVSLSLYALAFGLFRLFDIWKPWPIRDLDHRLGGGTGIMLDDLVAALYAALVLVFCRWLMV